MMLDRRRELVAGGRRWESDMHLGIVAEGTGGLRACPRQGGPPGAVERDLQDKGSDGPIASCRACVAAIAAHAVCFRRERDIIQSTNVVYLTRNGPTPSTNAIMGHKNNIDRKDFDFLRGFHKRPWYM